MDSDVSRRVFLGTAAGLGLSLATHAQDVRAALAETGTLLERIDCTQDYPADRYFSHGNVTIAESNAGRYREAEAKPLSRFGYRFDIENVGRPHVAIIRYPDDKRRYMCIMDGTSYDLTTGVFTGWEQPLTGQMAELRQVFWPRWKDCSIVFMTWSDGEPAAVASIEIHELESLPPLEVPCDPNDGSHRELGIQYEDPCGCCASEGATTRDEWIEHLVQYAQHSGQSLLAYPMAWYHGPQFPSEREPSDGFGLWVGRDRRQYSRWTTHPVDWYTGLLERFTREGLGFQGSLTLLRLGSLLEKMNVDLEAIQSGADTFNNMLWNDQVQSSTQDWTPIYNARNFNKMAEALKGKPPSEPWNLLPEWAYGEHAAPGAHTGPMFNPLHPTVRDALREFVREIGTRYARHPSFRGVSFNMFASAMPWFGSIHSGYDDYSLALFEEETAIHVPVDPNAPDRFSQRYAFLTTVCRPAWVAWRCRKICEVFQDLHETLSGARGDLRITITLWDETTVTNVLGQASTAHQLYARPSMLEFYRDAGIDIDLYRDHAGLEVDRGMGNSRDRGGHGANPCGGTTLPIEAQTMYRDFDALDEETLAAFRAHARPGAFIFNCWVEAWGRHVWFQPESGDPGIADASILDGQPAEGVLRINSEYPEDNFWWDSQLRITPGFPTALHFLEPYAFALAEFDACRITRGGLFLDKAHTRALRRFASAYRALPRVKFETVGETTDPVAVRTQVHEGKRLFYCVNREYYPIHVQLSFKGTPEPVRDLATAQVVEDALANGLMLGPYDLRVFSLPPDAEIVAFTATPPRETVMSIKRDTQESFAAFERKRAQGLSIPGMDRLEAGMRAALEKNRVAWLRRALTSYIVRKARQA